MRLLVISILAFIFIANVSAQEQTNLKKTKNFQYSIGLNAGFTTGLGLSHRIVNKRFGIQTTMLLLPHNKYSGLGLTLIYKLLDKETTSFGLYQSNLYSTYSTSGYDCEPPTYEFFNGGGFDVSIKLNKRFSLNIMGGLGFFDTFSEFTITGETCFYYNF